MLSKAPLPLLVVVGIKRIYISAIGVHPISYPYRSLSVCSRHEFGSIDENQSMFVNFEKSTYNSAFPLFSHCFQVSDLLLAAMAAIVNTLLIDAALS